MKKYTLRPPENNAAFRINYEQDLNAQQLDVVLAGDGPMLVIAGAGSGKTRTLTYRVARLVECGVPAEQIMLLTFTNKAAREMLRRVQMLLGSDLRLLGGTFHHVANIALRRYAELVGLRPNFTILDREDAADIMADIISGRISASDERKAPKADLLIELNSYALNTETPLARVLSQKFPALFEIADEIIRACNAYAHRKREMNAVDFDDLLVFWRDVLRKHDDVREAANARWRYVLVDEYQDTNRIQSAICEMIAGPDGNLMVVGDDAQSIYSFRGAHFGNIIDFPKRFPSTRMFKLETNYRSTPEILALANDSIANNKRQFEKTLHGHRAKGVLPERVVCGDASEQSRYVAQRMMELRDEGMDWRDIAILYRAHWHSMELQMELTQRGIPFIVRSGLRFFEQAHIKDVAAYLRVIANPLDEFAWKRIAKLYPRVGNAVADKIWRAIATQQEPLAAVIGGADAIEKAVPRGARESWRALAGVLMKIATPEMRRVPGEMIQQVLDGGYELYLETTFANWSNRADDVRRMADFAVRYADVQELLSELALTLNIAGQEAIQGGEDADVVILSTVHQAKGLEWRAVFGLWLVEGKLPDGRALREADGEEEERRLFYVMCTRAKDQLFLVHPTVGTERGMMGVIQKASRYVEELDPALYEVTKVGYEVGDE